MRILHHGLWLLILLPRAALAATPEATPTKAPPSESPPPDARPASPSSILTTTSTRSDVRIVAPTPSSAEAAASWARSATFFGGLGLVVGGSALTAVGWLAPDHVEYLSICRASPCGRTYQHEFKTGCDVTSGNASCIGRKGGVLVLPLGYSLAIAGATWAVGSSLADDDELLWIPLALGVVLGVASYAVSAAANGSNPVTR